MWRVNLKCWEVGLVLEMSLGDGFHGIVPFLN